MKVLITIYDATVVGGTERMVVTLANLLSEKKIDVTIHSFYKRNDCIPFELNENVRVVFGKRKENLLYSRWFWCFGINAKLFGWAQRMFVSYKMRELDYDVVISNGGDGVMPYFKNKKTKYIKVAHGNFNSYVGCKGIAHFDHLVILSNVEYARWRQKYPKIQIHTIPNFLNEIPSKESNKSQKVVVAVGRLVAEKGFYRLLDIWAKIKANQDLKEWKLHIVGDGHLKSRLQLRIKSRNVEDSVVLKPFTTDVGKEYLQASIYAMTSLFEGFPMVLLEAFSYALPIVAFDIITGPSEIIEHGKNGFLIADWNLEEFQKHLTMLMLNQDLRETLGKSGKQTISTTFHKEVIYQKWKAIMD